MVYEAKEIFNGSHAPKVKQHAHPILVLLQANKELYHPNKELYHPTKPGKPQTSYAHLTWSMYGTFSCPHS